MMRFLVILILFFCVNLRAAIISSNLFTLATVSLTTNTSPAVQLGTITLPQYTFPIQTVNTFGNTNSGGTILFGATTNIATMTPVGTYWATNDTIYSFVITNNGVVPCYFAFQAFNTGTSNIQIGAQAVINR